MLYLQNVFYEFSINFFSGWKKRKVSIVVQNFKCTDILVITISNVTTFPTSRKCKNFNFSFYTVPAEMQNLRKYLTNFHKSFFGSWKKRNLAIFVENFKRTDIFDLAIAMLQLFQHPENVKISIFPFTLSQQKSCIFKKYLTNFEKLFFRWRRMKVAIVVKNFKYTDTLVLKWQRYNSSNIQKMLKFQFFPFTLSQQKCHIFRGT